MSTVYVIVTVALAAVLLGSATAKLTRQQMIVDNLSGIGIPLDWLPRLAACEIAGALGLLVGIAVPPIGIAAAVGVVAYFIGAVAAHVRAGDKELAPPAVLLVVAIVALVLRIVTL